MKVFDIKKMKAYPYEQRQKNVFYKAEEFKARIIELPAGGEMPLCKMESHVIFFVVKGEAQVTVDRNTSIIKEGNILVAPPATLSMKTKKGIKIVGIQVMTGVA